MMLPEHLKEIQFELTRLDLQFTASDSYDQLLVNLSTYINHLILNDFNLLVSLLYRLDISEGKLRTLLQQNQHEQAATLIAQLIIERQVQVMEARKSFKRRDDIPEDEKW